MQKRIDPFIISQRMLNKKFLVISLSHEYCTYMYQDAIDTGHVYCCPLNILENTSKIKQFILRLYQSRALGKMVKLPFRKYAMRLYTQSIGIPNEEYDFLIFQMDMLRDDRVDFVKYLKQKYPEAKTILHFHDIISSRKGAINLDNLQYFDAAYHYDKVEADKYGFIYQPTFMSPIKVEVKDEYESDLFFCGVSKGRLQLLIDICKNLSEQGMKCLFLILNVPKQDRKEQDGVVYLDQFISYTEMIKYVQCSKCLLEIIQNGAVGCTLRTWEAILYNKKLLTNNYYLVNETFYNPHQVILFNDLESINCETLKSEYDNSIDYNVSPIPFFKRLEESFNS